MVQNGQKTQNKSPSNHSLSHERGNERSERTSKRVQRSARAKQVVPSKRTREQCERTDKRVTQYFSLYSWLFWTIVHCKSKRRYNPSASKITDKAKGVLAPRHGRTDGQTDRQTDRRPTDGPSPSQKTGSTSKNKKKKIERPRKSRLTKTESGSYAL